jgi:SH3-like domain-containing protein
MSASTRTDHRTFSAALARTARLIAAAALAGAALAGPAAAQRPADKPTPSGLPVPRWVSLKFGEVNARAGPGDDHRLVWVWKGAKGLPLQIVAETREWRKVCGPDGAAAWVHRRTVDGARRALNAGPRPLPLLARPEADARTRAFLVAGGAAELDRCDKGWCRLKVADRAGWTPETAVWGGGVAPRCR